MFYIQLKSIDKNEVARFSLGLHRYAVVTVFNNEVYLHIRQYKVDITRGALIPTKKGVSLKPTQFAMLKLNLNEINDIVKIATADELTTNILDFKTHIGRGIYCTVQSGYECVNIRKYFVPDGKTEPIPTKHGIAIRFPEWKKFISHLDDIFKISPTLKNAKPCFADGGHDNQEGAFSCSECYPFGARYYP